VLATSVPQPSVTPSGATAAGPTATLTVTSQPAPSVAESPLTRLETGKALQATGNCPAARLEFAALLAEQGTPFPKTPRAADPTGSQRTEAAYRLAQCYLADDAPAEASVVLTQLLATAAQDDAYRAPATFLLGEAQSALAEWRAAEDDYQRFLGLAPDLSYLTWQRIAAARVAGGDLTGAAASYASALDGSPDWNNTVTIRRALAGLALQQNDGPSAAAQYDILRGTLTTGAWAAEMQWLAGSALDKAGDRAAAVQRWQAATVADPTSGFAHSAMAALADAGATVDEFLRGQIDYNQGLYQLAIEAFGRYTSQNPSGQGGQVGLAWYYSGLCYIALGEFERGLAELGNFIAAYPDSPLVANAWLARARAQQSAGDTPGAIDTYRQFAAARPADPLAPKALFQAVNLEGDGNALETAAQSYLALARRYPEADEGWRSYLAAGLTYFRLNKWQQAADIWKEMAGANLSASGRAVAYYWLGRAQAAAGEPQAARASWLSAWQSAPTSFYGLRAADWAAQGGQPLPGPTPAVSSPVTQTQLTAGLAAWLRGWAGDGSLSLPPSVLADADWRRGELLLQLGMRAPGLAAWTNLQRRHEKEPWTQASLAIAFADAGAHRLSILCAEELAGMAPGGELSATPLALQRLAYPLPYLDLLTSEANRQGLDPLLVAAVIRQESRFDSEAISSAAAQGLMQIMPDTANWIASRLGWSDFTSDQIYRPYINVAFGAYYLQWGLKQFNNSIAATLAGYNGGPGNAALWRKLAPNDDDLMVALIDLPESRLYVQVVWSQYDMYRRLYP
jgi:soluble lytic murein transglycosylase